jgi:hypothetical protein
MARQTMTRERSEASNRSSTDAFSTKRPFNNRKTKKGRNRKQVITSHVIVKLAATYTKSGKLMREAAEYLKPVRKLITHELG